MKRDLWVLYGGPAPRRVIEILAYAEAGSTPARIIPGWAGGRNTPYRYTTTRVRLAGGREHGAPLGHLFYGTRAEADDMLTRPMGAPRPGRARRATRPRSPGGAVTDLAALSTWLATSYGEPRPRSRGRAGT